jgi:uncharacterized protein (TIGR02246 family)
VVSLFLFSVLGLTGSAASAQTPDQPDANAVSAQAPDPNTVKEIISLLNKHDQALNQKDLNTVMSLYATGDTTVLMGTGPGEKWVGKDEISDAYNHFFQDFDKGSLAHDCFWKTGGARGDMAWLTAICKMSDSLKNKKREYGLNISAVLERQGGAWLIRAMHFSHLTGPGTSGAVSQRGK